MPPTMPVLRTSRSSWTLKSKSSKSSLYSPLAPTGRTLTLSAHSAYSDDDVSPTMITGPSLFKEASVVETKLAEPLFHESYISSEEEDDAPQTLPSSGPEWSSDDDSNDLLEEDTLIELTTAVTSVVARKVSIVSVGKPKVITVSTPPSRRGSEACLSLPRRASDMLPHGDYSPIMARRRGSDVLPHLGKLPMRRLDLLPTVPATPPASAEPQRFQFSPEISSDFPVSTWQSTSPAWSLGSTTSIAPSMTDSVRSEHSPASSISERPALSSFSSASSERRKSSFYTPVATSLPSPSFSETRRSRPKSLFWSSSASASVSSLTPTDAKPAMVQSLSYTDTLPPSPESRPTLRRSSSRSRQGSLSKEFFNKLKSKKSLSFDQRMLDSDIPPVPALPPVLPSPLPSPSLASFSPSLQAQSGSPSPAMSTHSSPKLDAPSWAAKDDFVSMLMGSAPPSAKQPATTTAAPREREGRRKSVVSMWFK